MQRREIINKVLQKMDESSPQGNLDELQNVPIDTVLDEAAKIALTVLPAWVTLSKPLTATPNKNADGSGYIALPTDYLKLARLWMSGWLRPVTSTINEQHPSYLHQLNPVLRGGTAKPVVAEVTKDGNRRLEYYSLPATQGTHTIKEGYYVPKLKAEAVPDNVLDALVWKAAELAFQVMGDSDRMQLCAQRFEDACKTIVA